MIGTSYHCRTLRALVAVVLAACAAGPAAAQENVAREFPRARVGDLVRVTSGLIPGKVSGELVLVRNDSLYVRPGASRAVAVPLARVEWIEVRHRRSRLEGMVLGVGVGAPTGAATGFLLGTLSDRGGCADECGFVPRVLAAAGALAGTVLGGFVGGAAPGGRWVPAARPNGGGVALSLGSPP